MKQHITLAIICSLLVFLFLYTGVSKWLDFNRFTHDMYNQPFPSQLMPYLVWSVPVLEVVIALALLFDKTRTAGLYASLVLMAAFTVYTAAVLFHVFDRVPCSCGGVIRQLSWGQHLVFNIFFTAIAVAGILLHKKIKAMQSQAYP